MTEVVNPLLVIAVILMMVLSAFFSGMEIAFVSSNRMLIEMDKERSSLAQRILNKFYKNPNAFVSTMLVGNNIVLVIYGILTARIFDQTLFKGFDAAFTVPADTVLSSLVVLFTGEFIPKVLFKSNPNSFLAFFSLPANFFYIILWPISKFSTFVSRFLLGVFGVKISPISAEESFSKVDLDYLLQTSIDNAAKDEEIEHEVKIFQNALELRDIKVRDCMVPRTEINAVDISNCTLELLQQKFIESGNSKLIVYKDSIDHIVGYIHSSEMFKNPSLWKTSICKIPFVPETMSVQKLMHIFLQEKKSLGVVVDEFGGTSGIVSLEDIVEEIFGEIEDEHDSAKYVAKQVAPNAYLLSARLEIDKINDMFNLELPESDDYITLGGWILHEYQSFPKINEVILIDRYELKVIKNTMTKIELVKMLVKS